MSKWFGIAFVVIGVSIYRSTFEPTLLGSAIVGAISGGIGGVIGGVYDHYLGKYDFNITDFIDNVLWFILFCIPGIIVGTIISSSVSYLIGNSANSTFLTLLSIFFMLLVSGILTIKKIKSKQRKRSLQIEEKSSDM